MTPPTSKSSISADECSMLVSIFSQCSESIYIEDERGCVVFWNAGAEALYGRSSASMLGKNADEVLGVSVVKGQHAAAYVEQYGISPRWKGLIRVEGPAGKMLDVERRRNKVGRANPLSATAVFDVDLSDRKDSQIVDRRRQRLESLGTLASGIAHDLNNLLTPILMSSKMLARHDPAINRDALIETIHQSATRGAGLIEQLLLFARGGEGQHRAIDLVDVVRDTGMILRRTLSEQIELRLSVPEQLPAVLSDETEISQVIMNLAINARDAMPKGGRLTISAEVIDLMESRFFTFSQLPAGRYIRIEISDSGVGIPPDQRDRIFEPFFSTKERGQGTGLGLSTSLGIIKSHGGAVDVRSAVGEGTHVSVMLPTIESTR